MPDKPPIKLAYTLIFLAALLPSACIPGAPDGQLYLGNHKNLSSIPPVGKFRILNESVLTLQAKTSETFAHIQRSRRELAVLRTEPSEKLTLQSFKPESPSETDRFGADLWFREAALDVLAKYTALLCAVCEGEPENHIDKALEELAGSLNTLRHAPKPEKTDADVVAAILKNTVPATRNAFFQKNRLDTLRELTNTAQKDIRRLVALSIGGNEAFAEAVREMSQQMIALMDERRPVYEDYVDPALVEHDRRAAAMVSEAEKIQRALKALKKAAALVPDAHFSVKSVLGQPLGGSGELQRLIQATREVATACNFPFDSPPY